jgi:site-specific recombinase XerD
MNEIIAAFERDLTLRALSKRTIKTYSAKLKGFFAYYRNATDCVTGENVKNYLYHLLKEKGLSNETVRQCAGAIKFYCRYTGNIPCALDSVPQLKQAKRLPEVLNLEEVARLLRCAANVKHRTMLTLAYASGLRVSEIPALKPSDIKRDSLKLLVRHAKGNKDRYTVLSRDCLSLLESYWRAYHPKDWLFPGRQAGPISVRACQHAFEIAKTGAGISKPGGIHMLRHSFATHSLEAGTGIFQLQKMMGHANLKTTLVYVHITEEKVRVESPFDAFRAQFTEER